MKKIFLTLAILAGIISSAQVKIGGTVITNIELNPSSLLELESTTQGVLFPRMALTSTTSPSPLAGQEHVAGMVVYNTATTGDVTTGMYANDGAKWVKMGAIASSNLYSSDGTLTATRTVTQNNNDLTFVTGTGKTIVNGNFKTTGAVYANVRTVTLAPIASDYLSSDQYVIIKVSGTANIALPDPTTNSGRVITIRNGSSQAGTSGAYTITVNVPMGSTSILINKAQTYISDGTSWYMMNY